MDGYKHSAAIGRDRDTSVTARGRPCDRSQINWDNAQLAPNCCANHTRTHTHPYDRHLDEPEVVRPGEEYHEGESVKEGKVDARVAGVKGTHGLSPVIDQRVRIELELDEPGLECDRCGLVALSRVNFWSLFRM